MSRAKAFPEKQLYREKETYRNVQMCHTCLRARLFITIMGETPGWEPGMKGTRGAVGMLCAAVLVGPMSSKSVWSKALKYPELASTVRKYCNIVSVKPSNYVQL